MKNIRRKLNLITILLVFSLALFAQEGSGVGDGKGNENSNEISKERAKLSKELVTYLPRKWETYLADDDKVGVLFPKLPLVLEDYSNSCIGESKINYIAYSNNKVYVFQTVKKVTPHEFCKNKKTFSEKNLANRLNDLSLTSNSKLDPIKIGKFELHKFLLGNEILWLYQHVKNNGWYELRVVSSNEIDTVAKTFLESFAAEKNQKGISIGKGATSIIGDTSVVTEVKIEKSDITAVSQVKKIPMKLIFQPRAIYTDSARINKITGSVKLRVTFMANGGISGISVASALPFGLTEQAIAAARKIVFIPQQTGKSNNSVTRLVEYSFNIY